VTRDDVPTALIRRLSAYDAMQSEDVEVICALPISVCNFSSFALRSFMRGGCAQSIGSECSKVNLGMQLFAQIGAGTGRPAWPLDLMDRLYLTIIFGGIILLVTALALSAPGDPRNGRADDVVVLHAPRR
jgi:hypothetical protein